LIFEESIFGPLHTLRDPVAFAHTNFGENILIGGDDMPPEWNSKKRSLAAEFYIGFKVDAFTRSGTYVRVIVHNFSKIR